MAHESALFALEEALANASFLAEEHGLSDQEIADEMRRYADELERGRKC